MAKFMSKLFVNQSCEAERNAESTPIHNTIFNAGRIKLIAIPFLFTSISTHANWYAIDNYEGKIGSAKVHVSLQTYEHFGGGNIRGSYYYDKYSAPIPLYGQRTNSSMKLCEVHSGWGYELDMDHQNKDGTHFCPFALTTSDDEVKGTWQHEGSTHIVLLVRSNSLKGESIKINKQEGVEIPYWGQTPTHSFIGIYQKNENGIYIDKINIINKSTGKVDQTINPQSKTCDFGFYMTSIYQNIEGEKSPPQVRLNCYSTKGDISNNYKFDRDSKKYLLIDNY